MSWKTVSEGKWSNIRLDSYITKQPDGLYAAEIASVIGTMKSLHRTKEEAVAHVEFVVLGTIPPDPSTMHQGGVKI